MVLDLHNSLKDGGVVFGVGVHLGLDLLVGLCLVHLALNVHDLREQSKDVCLGKLRAIEENVVLPQPV